MRGGSGRVLVMAMLGAGGGAIAALAAYAVRSPARHDVLDLTPTIKVDDLTLSVQPWAIVGLSLLGALVCGSVAAASAANKGQGRALRAFLIAAPLGAFLCWGARWLMDLFIRSAAGGAETVDPLTALRIVGGPWLVWQGAVAVGLTLPVVLGIGVSRFTVVRGMIGALLIIVLSMVVSGVVDAALAAALIGSALSRGGSKLDVAQISDVVYLFTMGMSTGLAFAIAEAVYKPAWLKSRGGLTEGRTWALRGPVSRVGSMEGVEVFLPPDGSIAPVHCQIQSQGEAHFVTDLVGGTLVNGQPVQAAWLRDGDMIGVGSAGLIYKTRLSASPVAQPMRPIETPLAPMPEPIALAPTLPVLVDPMGNRHSLHLGANVIGREVGCDIALTWEPSLSRRHAEVTVNDDGSVWIRDLGSTNGTSIGGERLSDVRQVSMGSEIGLGQVKVTISATP